ncbi:MAG: site-2 protease family protein [Candidatus Korobacteraceae bacterium]
MKWSWKLGRFAGIDVFVHATFVLLLGWIALSHWTAERSIARTLAGVGFILALFLCVVLHEYGHALTARRFGIRTRDITLLPIGGVARLERMPEDPRQELLVAIAGPAVNVVIAACIFAGLIISNAMEPVGTLGVTEGSFFERLMLINLGLVAFNILPAFPMDGGRVLRALLAMRMDYVRATQIAANVGQGMALLFGFVGLLWNPFLIFIALFVWIGAAGEAAMVQMKSALGGIPVTRAMLTVFRTLTPMDSLSRATEHILAGSQQDFPVVSDGVVVGILTRDDLIKGLSTIGPAGLVGNVMQRNFETADPGEMLEVVFRRLQECSCHTVPVVRNGYLVGILTTDNITEFLMIDSALRKGAHSPGALSQFQGPDASLRQIKGVR